MKRRSFLNSGALGILGVSSFNFNNSPYKNLDHVKISLTPWSIIRSGYESNDPLDIKLLEFPGVAKSLGFDYIDLEMGHFPTKLKTSYINKLNKSIDSARVKSAVMLTGGSGDIGDKDLSKRKKALEIYKYWIDVAADLNCRAVRNVCGEYITISHDEKLKYAIEGVGELANYAKSKGIILLIENHNGYSSYPIWMISLMEGIKIDNLGILGDFTNWTLKRNPDTFYPDPYIGFELLSPYIMAISAKSEKFDSEGNETTTDYKRMFKILSKSPNFIFAGVEFFGNGISRNRGALLTRKLIEKTLKSI